MSLLVQREAAAVRLEQAFEMDQALRRPLDASPEHRAAAEQALGR